jgi:hypothetical protein
MARHEFICLMVGLALCPCAAMADEASAVETFKR